MLSSIGVITELLSSSSVSKSVPFAHHLGLMFLNLYKNLKGLWLSAVFWAISTKAIVSSVQSHDNLSNFISVVSVKEHSAHCELSQQLIDSSLLTFPLIRVSLFSFKNQLHKPMYIWFVPAHLSKEICKNIYEKEGIKTSNGRNRNLLWVFKILLVLMWWFILVQCFIRLMLRLFPCSMWEKWKLIWKHKRATKLHVLAAGDYCFPHGA